MIQVIERFHKIIEHISANPDKAVSLSELAALIDVSSPACSNIIRTMVALGYLESEGERKGYRMGATPYYLVRNGQYQKHLVNTVRPYLEALVQELGEFFVLVVESAGRRAELLKYEAESMIQLKPTDTQKEISLFSSATGCLLLSYMSDERFKELWDKRVEKEGSLFKTEDFDEVQELRKQNKKRGYFANHPKKMTEELMLNGSATMAFPIYKNGEVVAALGSRVPFYRFTGERKDMMIEKCLATARQISDKLSETL